MNKHNDHVASCLCCKFCEVDFESDISDVTPGRGWRYECTQGIWETAWGDGLEFDKEVAHGTDCEKFIPKEYKLVRDADGVETFAKMIVDPKVGSMWEFINGMVTTPPLFDENWTVVK